MIALLLATVISFIAPTYDAVKAGSCEPDSIPVPCHDLATAFVYGERQGQTTPQLFQTIPLDGREGQLISFTPTPPDHPTDVWSIFITVADSTGNQSCWSNVTSINGTVSVPPVAPPSDEKDEWYDIQGRRLHHKPHLPGVYYHRRGLWHKVVVILE